MKAGIVVTVRLNPQDVMGCIDLVTQSGGYFDGMSLSQCIKLALTGTLEALRQQNTIPRRDGFEYEAMVSRFNVAHRRKLAVSEAVQAAEVERIVLDRPTSALQVDISPRPSANADEDFDRAVVRKSRILIRLQELGFKKESDPLNWSKQEEAEMEALKSEYSVLDRIEVQR